MTQEPKDTQTLSQSQSDSTLSPGAFVAEKYQILSTLGSGGMGTVYRVQQVLLGKDFALKVLDVHQQSDIAVRRFQLEARTTAQLRHPNLVEVHDFGLFGDSQPYLVMDYIEGQTLAQVLKSSGTLPVDYVVALAIQVGFALMYAHSKGVVHRDIKPGNIIVIHPGEKPAEGTVKVVDFGIAKLMQSEDGQIQELTRTGEVFGSPIYMSPEQCKGTAVDQRSDIYSLGCVLFECLTGSPPFFAENAMSTMVKRLTEKPVTLKEGSLGLTFPPLLESIVQKMLAIDPVDRYQEFGDLIKDLMRVQLDDKTEAPHSVARLSSSPSRKLLSKRELTIACVTAMICCAATLAVDRTFFFLPAPQEPSQNSSTKSGTDKSEVSKTESAKPVTKLAEFETQFGPVLQPPTLEVKETNGFKQEYLHFPSDCGRIIIGENKKRIAYGDFPLKPGEPVSIELTDVSAGQPRILQNLSEVNFGSIDFLGKMTVTDNCIAQLEHLKHIQALSLTDSDISNLKPIYDAGELRNLDVMATHISDDEIQKLKCFPLLTSLSFGPLKDPSITLRALTKASSLKFLQYRGTVPDDTYWTSRGIIPSDVDLIVQLPNLDSVQIENSPNFDEACLRKLKSIKGLKYLSLKDCSISPAAIPIFKTLKLEKLELTDAARWSKADKKRIAASLIYPVEFVSSTLQKREEEHAKQEKALKIALPATGIHK